MQGRLTEPCRKQSSDCTSQKEEWPLRKDLDLVGLGQERDGYDPEQGDDGDKVGIENVRSRRRRYRYRIRDLWLWHLDLRWSKAGQGDEVESQSLPPHWTFGR